MTLNNTNDYKVVTTEDAYMTFEQLWEQIAKLVGETNSVESKPAYLLVLDKKAELLSIVNDALETGYWQGKDRDGLLAMKIQLDSIERLAVRQARDTFRKGIN